jgi:hypothetical protein
LEKVKRKKSMGGMKVKLHRPPHILTEIYLSGTDWAGGWWGGHHIQYEGGNEKTILLLPGIELL